MNFKKSLLLFLLVPSSLITKPKNKTFNNVDVLGWLQAKNFSTRNAHILGNLFVKGKIFGAGGSNLVSGSSGGVNTQGSTTPNAVARFVDSSGTLIQNSPVLVDDSGNVTLNGITKNGNTVSWPSNVGAAGTFLESDGAGNLVYGTASGAGNVSTALPFSTNNAIITTDTPSGAENIKQAGVTLDGSNNISGVNTLAVNTVNAITLNGNLNGNATSATNFTGPLSGDVTGGQSSTVVSSVGGQTAANVAAGTVLANNSTSSNTASTIVRRDGSGNFSATNITSNLTGNVTGNLSGNATTATSATTATNATNFTGPLVGDVTGTQGATVVSTVGGQSAANVASGAVAANAATNTNTASTIVRRDGSGNFSAGTVTANLTGNVTGNLSGNATTATNATSATNFTGPLLGDVTGGQSSTVVSFVGGQTAINVAAGTALANNSTSSNTASTIVRRDGSGNFSAGTITGNLSGNATSATTATNSTNFTGALSGDVTGNQGSTVVSTVGGQTAANVAAGTVLANNATDANTAGTIVRRDGSGNFSAGIITANLSGNSTTATSATTATNATNFTGPLVGDVTGTQGATVVSFVGGQSAANVASGVVAANAATNTNTANTIVKRDGSGNFSAGTITANLTGNVTGNLSGNATTATSATSATNFTGSLSGDVTGNQSSTVVSTVGGQTAANVAAGTALANNSTSSNTASTIVRRDGSGNFSAGTITANLSGNATSATTATNATNFTGSLSGDVTGTQSATVVSAVGGKTAASIATSVNDTTAATNSNTPSTIVKRDGSGNFSATNITSNLTGDVTGNLFGNATTATNTSFAYTATNFSGSLAGDVTGTQNATVVSFVGGQSAANVASGVIAANAATNTNTASTIVKRDGSGNFQAGTITANLTGNVTGNLSGNATTATNATTAVNFSGSLAGDVTGTQGATVVSSVGGQTAANVAAGTVLANNSTSSNTASTIVRRDGSGNFSGTNITSNLTGNVTGNVVGDVTGNLSGNATSATTAVNSTNFTGPLLGDVTGFQTTTTVAFVGGQTAAAVALATIATNGATSNNTASTIVKRDGSGNFSTNMITLNGTVSNPTDAATKDYVDSAVSTGFTVHDPCLVMSNTVNVTLSGLQTIDGVSLSANDRVLLNGQTNQVQNGIWLAQSSSWTRPSDFNTGSTAGAAYVLITSGTVYVGTSWVCTTPSATIDTNPITFAQFSTAGQTTAANVGSGAGQIFRDKTGNTINLKTLAAGTDIVITNNANDINIATNATSSNTPNTIVQRDASGNFSAGTITANLTGAASQNVLKTGDTMTGNLTMAAQSEIRFQDASGGEYVGLHAPTTVGSSYTVSLPSSAPTSGQFLNATSTTASQWASIGGATAKTYYVSKGGSNSNDGSFASPFLTISHAVTVVNSVASLLNPILIKIGPGIFVENNSGGPITISANGVSIVGSSSTGTIIIPTTTSNNLFNFTTSNLYMGCLTLDAGTVGSTASGISIVAGFGLGAFQSLIFSRFQTGISINGTGSIPQIAIAENVASTNGTAISVNNARVFFENSIILGENISNTIRANTGFVVTGTNALATLSGNAFRLLNAGVITDGGANTRILSTSFDTTTTGIYCTGGSESTVVGCCFQVNDSSTVNVQATGANTHLNITGCSFDGEIITSNNPKGTALKVTDDAVLEINSCAIEDVQVGLECGQSGDTILTKMNVSGVKLSNCITDIIQLSSSKLNFLSGSFDDQKVSIADSTNVNFVAFDTSTSNLSVGSMSDASHVVYSLLNGQPQTPSLVYEPNYYGNKGTVYKDINSNPVFDAIQSDINSANYYVITGDRTKDANINLISDSGSIGTGDNVRGWGITKLGTSASLAFTYTNNDSSGQALRGSNTVMQLNGFDNQVEFPTATNSPLPTNTVAKLVWGSDTNLYRLASNSLKTDSNFSVGALNATGVVHNDNTGLLSTSLIVNADVDPAAAIVDTKLATISTAGKVANSATSATSSNTPNTIVLRDSSGNFSANTITASLTGPASANVLKTGDTMTGSLNMAAQSEVRFQDAAGGEYVGLRAPTAVPSSYTIDLPPFAPAAGQVLQATSAFTTTWATAGGSPSVAKTYYVAKGGSDSNDGSFSAPFLTIRHAVTVANTVASSVNPVVISIGAGLFVENNSGGSITISANGISIVGSSTTGTIIVPTTLSNDLFSCTTSNIYFTFFTLSTGGAPGSTASGLSITAGTGQGGIQSIIVAGFQTGIAINGSVTVPQVVFTNVVCLYNGIGLSVNNARVVMESSIMLGSPTTSPANTAISVTGLDALVTLIGNSLRLFANGVTATGGSNVRILSNNIETTTNSLVANGASNVAVVGCNFIFNNSSSINVNASGANTLVTLDGCQFQCNDSTGTPQGTAIKLTTGAAVLADSCAIEKPVVGIACGAPGDTATTSIKASGVTIVEGTTNIIQVGSSMLQFVGGIFDETKISIADPTNVSFASFNDDAELVIGSSSDLTHTLYNVLNGQASLPELTYEPNYYGNKGTVYQNPNSDPTFNATQSNSNSANYYVITGDRTKDANINLISDSGSIGTGDNVRGWGITKLGTSASLAFTYTNNDSSGQALRGSNTVMQLNGFDNQVEFPTATNSPLPTNTVAKLVWGSDTNLYRLASNSLKTDSNFSVGALNTTGVVHNDNTGLLSTSLIVNADVDPAAAIVDTKLATISTAGKVANSATSATSSNTPNTIVLRDSSGNFSANTITASLTGTASANVLKTGDTMTGSLNMAAQSEVRFQDAAGGEYVGLRASGTIGSSYTVDLPATAPVSGQFLQATSASATTWASAGGSPTVAKTYYVAKGGSDSNDGSILTPFLTVSHAVTVANGVASSVNPIVISIGAGIFVENNSGGAITISANGISIRGSSNTGTIIIPTTLSIDLFSCTTSNVFFNALTLSSGAPGSTASGISINAGAGQCGIQAIIVSGFQTGVSLNGSATIPQVVFASDVFLSNGTAISINNVRVIIENSIFLGASSGVTPLNSAISITGLNSLVTMMGNSLRLFVNGISTTGGANLRVLSTNFETTTNSLICSGASTSAIVGCNFIVNNFGAININASGASTTVALEGCQFNCTGTDSVNQGTAIKVTNNALIYANSSSIENAVLGIQCGTTGDTVLTAISANGLNLINTTTDIIQLGSSSLAFSGGVFDHMKVNLADPTNVNFTGFDPGGNLVSGSGADVANTVYEIFNGGTALPDLKYQPNYYGYQGTVYENPNSDPTVNATQADSNNASYYVVTGDRTKDASISLISDSGNIGTGDNVRGWGITKLGTSASLAFTYTNNDSSGQALRGSNTVMQLNGFDNQVEFPVATVSTLPTSTVAKLVWAGDTNLYRGDSGILQTDGNVIIGGLTASKVVVTDANKKLTSSATSASELSNLAGVTSPIQAQIDSKVAKAGDTMTGALQLPAGSTALPSLNFTGNPTVGLSANSGNLSISTAATERLKVSSTGTVSINGFGTAGVVHNDASGNLSSSLIVNADVDSAAAIVDTKLATISTAGKVSNSATTATNLNTANAIVSRDASGNFIAGAITATLNGNATSATTAGSATNFTGSLVGDVTGTQGATVVSTVGGQTAANVAAGAVLANAATSANTASTIVRRDASGNFVAGTITANLTGNVTGSSSLNVLKAGDTMTGTLTHPAGTAAAPSVQFTGSTNTGLSAATANTISFDANGTEQMTIGTAAITAKNAFIFTQLMMNQAVQIATPTNNSTVTASATTSILLLTNTANRTGVTINFPPSPTDGQFFSIVLGTTSTIAFTSVGGTGGATIVNAILSLAPASAPTATANGTAVTYYYYATNNAWYRYSRG